MGKQPRSALSGNRPTDQQTNRQLCLFRLPTSFQVLFVVASAPHHQLRSAGGRGGAVIQMIPDQIRSDNLDEMRSESRVQSPECRGYHGSCSFRSSPCRSCELTGPDSIFDPIMMRSQLSTAPPSQPASSHPRPPVIPVMVHSGFIPNREQRVSAQIDPPGPLVDPDERTGTEKTGTPDPSLHGHWRERQAWDPSLQVLTADGPDLIVQSPFGLRRVCRVYSHLGCSSSCSSFRRPLLTYTPRYRLT